jgi:hypothetical protein
MLPRASLGDTLALFAAVLAPTIAQGPIIRRPRVVALAERLGLDRRAIRQMQRLAARYGSGPLMLSIPGTRRAIVLSPAHVARVLDQSPDPFATATREKHAALEHFEPRGALISGGAARADRRRFNEAFLRFDGMIHPLAERFVGIVDDERSRLLLDVRRRGALRWGEFFDTWFRMVRRLVLGESAADDRDLTDAVTRLRKDANWAMLRPVRRRLRAGMLARLSGYLQRAEPGSLAAVAARIPKTDTTAPADQVPQWLFAFDAAAMATFRALALLATHEEHASRVRAEIREGDPICRPLPLLRGTRFRLTRLGLLDPSRPLPATLNHFGLRFEVAPLQ